MNKTQYQQARNGIITDQMKSIARSEGISPDEIRRELSAGRLVIPANHFHLSGAQDATKLTPCGIGRILTAKINVNFGASPLDSCKEHELLKLKYALQYGTDTVMDLSTGGDLDEIREFLIANCPAA